MTTAKQREAGYMAIIVGMVQVMLWIIMGVAMMRIVPQFVKIFKDFDVRLPTMAVIVISFTDFLLRYWFVALVPLLAWPAVNWAVVYLVSPRPEVVIPRRLWYLTTWIVPPLLWATSMAIVYHALVVLIEKLS